MDFKPDFKTIREIANLTQQQVADGVGLSVRQYIKYEKYQVEPKFTTWQKVVKFIGENANDSSLKELLNGLSELSVTGLKEFRELVKQDIDVKKANESINQDETKSSLNPYQSESKHAQKQGYQHLQNHLSGRSKKLLLAIPLLVQSEELLREFKRLQALKNDRTLSETENEDFQNLRKQLNSITQEVKNITGVAIYYSENDSLDYAFTYAKGMNHIPFFAENDINELKEVYKNDIAQKDEEIQTYLTEIFELQRQLHQLKNRSKIIELPKSEQ